MKKNKNKSMIKLLMWFALIIIILILAILIFLKNNKPGYGEQGIGIERQNKPQQVTSYTMFYTVDNCIKSYLKENQNIYKTVEMYEIKFDEYTSYYAKCKKDEEYSYFEIDIDENGDATFDIIPLSERSYDNKIRETIDLDEYEVKKIEKNENNILEYKHLTNEQIAREYYLDFIKLMLSNSSEAYNILDSKLKSEKFQTLESFNQYIETNKEKYIIMYKLETLEAEDYKSVDEYHEFIEQNGNLGILKYSTNKLDNNMRFICINGYGDQYAFDVKYPGTYVVSQL